MGREPPALVASTLRDMLHLEPSTVERRRRDSRSRLPASTASQGISPDFGREDDGGIHLRAELRQSDRALSDIRTELWQSQERSRRLASEVWRMDSERTRVEAVEAALAAEVAGLLQTLHLRPKRHGEHAAGESASELERRMRELLALMVLLRSSIGEGGLLLEASTVAAERRQWRKDRDSLQAKLAKKAKAAADT